MSFITKYFKIREIFYRRSMKRTSKAKASVMTCSLCLQPPPERFHCSKHWCPVSDSALWTPLCRVLCAGLQADITKESPNHLPRSIHSTSLQWLLSMLPPSHLLSLMLDTDNWLEKQSNFQAITMVKNCIT